MMFNNKIFYNKSFLFTNLTFSFFPISFFFGNLATNINFILFCLLAIYNLKSKIFSIKFNLPLKIIVFLFFIIFLSTAISFFKSFFFTGYEYSYLERLIKSAILKSNLILWNGPLGVFEHKPFDRGTNEIAEVIKTDVQKLKIITFAGGSDTIAAINKAKAEKYFTYISTAGGAFPEWLEGKEAPGVKALKNNRLA